VCALWRPPRCFVHPTRLHPWFRAAGTWLLAVLNADDAACVTVLVNCEHLCWTYPQAFEDSLC
jgi:hypothetical protein